MKLADVPRVDAKDFLPPRLGGEPTVVTGLAEGWDALQAWTPDYLKAIAGDVEVAARETNGPPRNVYQNLADGGFIPFSDYIDWVLSVSGGEDLQAIANRNAGVSDIVRMVCASGFERCYYLDAGLRQLSERLSRDVETPRWYRTDPVGVLFWCGILGTSSGLHSDVKPNCNVQVHGRKHFALFHPSQARNLYRVRGITHCRFDPNLPDYDSFPLARRASGLQCTLEPAEGLYIPVGWFHQVTVVSPWSINVNFFWLRPFPQGLATPTLWRLLVRRAWARISVALSGRSAPP